MSSEISFDFPDNSVGTSLHQNEETRGRLPTTPRNRGPYSRSLSPGGLQTTSTGIHRSTSADVSRFSPFSVVDAGPLPDYEDSSSVQMISPGLVFIPSESASHVPSMDETRSTAPWLSTDNLSGRGRRRHRDHTPWSRSPSPYSRPRTSTSMDPMGDLASPHLYRSDHIHNWQEGVSMAESGRGIRWNQLPPHTTPEHIRLRESIITSGELIFLRSFGV